MGSITPSEARLPFAVLSWGEAVWNVEVREGWYRQSILSKGGTAKIVQSKGLWEGVEAGI